MREALQLKFKAGHRGEFIVLTDIPEIVQEARSYAPADYGTGSDVWDLAAGLVAWLENNFGIFDSPVECIEARIFPKEESRRGT